MKRILVTGGAGFLGSNLSRKLLAQGNEVLCLDNFFTGRRANVLDMLDNPYFELMRHDVINEFSAEVDEIYNLACPASPPHYQFDPVRTTRVSVMGAINCLELARRTGAKVLLASTSEVYGDPEISPQPESYRGNVSTTGIRACYDEGKRCAETLFFDYWRQYQTAIRVVRIFNTYGPGMDPDDGRVVSNFINQALRNEPITIYGDGLQTRSFCYVDDLVDGLIAMMENQQDFVGPVNLGNPDEFSMLELANEVTKLVGSNKELTFCPLPSDDPLQRKPAIDLAIKELGWQSKVPLKEGLAKTIAYFKGL